MNKKFFLASILFILAIGIFLRFFNYNWGGTFYLHPDERNIASAVTRLEFPENLNPEFFAYGSLPIYTVYFFGIVQNILSGDTNITNVSFEQSIIFLRLISVTLSSIIVLLVYYLLKEKFKKKYALFGAFLTAFNVGLIQYAHFGTFEVWLTFLFLVLFWTTYKYLKNESIKKLVFSGFIAGLLISVKISSLTILPILFAVILIRLYRSKYFQKSKSLFVKKAGLSFLIVIVICSLTLLLTFPYFVLDLNTFTNSMRYESAVALGNIDVFYTGGFVNTIPIIYQFIFVYPFILNPVNLIFFIILLPFIVFKSIKKKDEFILLGLSFFAIIFLSQAFLYVKWIRYYIPTIPFLILLIVFGIKIFFDKLQEKNLKPVPNIIIFIMLLAAFIFSFSYFKTVLLDTDSRIQAKNFAKKNIPKDSRIISEVYDLGIVPFNSSFSRIELFDFYALDEKHSLESKNKELEEMMKNHDYLILPSQRILRNRIIYEDEFPKGHNFYNNLDKNHDLIYKTKCDIFCRILYLGNPVYSVEETANVFDRPIIRIYEIKN